MDRLPRQHRQPRHYHGGRHTSAIESGRIGWTDLPGKLSGYDRKGLVYLPPQYSEAKYARVRFPVVELFHGTPGTPLAWSSALHISQVADSLIAKHLIGPMVLVMPAINGSGHDYQDCVNGPGVADETYLVRGRARRRLRPLPGEPRSV